MINTMYLNPKNPEIVEINGLLDRFVYSCSHDLKGPLTSIKGLLKLVEMSDTKESQNECLTLINESVVRMDNFLKSLENYMGNARGPIVRNEINFSTLINDILKKKRMEISEGKIKTNLRIKQPVTFKSDDMRVGLVLSNIINNAIYFQDMSKNEHFVDIEVNVNRDEVKVEVCDNGEGISKENIGKIYRMFFRASEASKGSGLGLYLAHEAVKKLGGKLTVVSSKGVGTNFIVKLPNTYTEI